MSISKKMICTPLTNPINICKECQAYKQYINGQFDIGQLRWSCQYCKSFGRNGIYKGDLVISALSANANNKTRGLSAGRKPTHYKRYGHAVMALASQGKTIRDIANIIGISTTTVQRIMTKYK